MPDSKVQNKILQFELEGIRLGYKTIAYIIDFYEWNNGSEAMPLKK